MVTLDWQFSLLPERCDERLAALCSPELGACIDSQFGEILGTEVSQFVMLPMRPEVFDRVQLGCIGWQELQVDGALLALDILANQPAAMCLEPIPDDQKFSVAQMPPQRFEEGDDLRRPCRALHQFEVDVPEANACNR